MISILKPQREDAEGINEVIKASWYATYITPDIGVTKEDIDLVYAQNEAQQIEVFRKRIDSPKENDITLVAKEENRIVGVIRLVVLDDHIRVRTLYVHPNFTGKGIGTMLWNEVKKYIPRNKNVIAFPAQHTQSVNWYKKMGFIETGKILIDEQSMPVSGIQLRLVEMQFNAKA